MMQTYLANSACWIEHMSLDPETGLGKDFKRDMNELMELRKI